MTPSFPADTSASRQADRAAESADAVIRSAREKAHDALDGLSDTVKTMKEQASATLERLRPQLDSVASYAREEPTKALLISAAAGAGLMALVSILARSGSSSNGSRLADSAKDLGKSASSTADEWRKVADGWRKAAMEKADDWRKAASDATDTASRRADDATSSAKSVARAAESAYGGITDTVQQWRDKAGPVLDKFRPQIDAVTTYAKDDPGKALLIAVAAGAALMGLMGSINR